MSNSPVPTPSEPSEKEEAKSSHHVPVSRWMLTLLGLIAVAFLVGVGVLVTKLADKGKTDPTAQAVVATKAATPTHLASTPTPAPSPTPDSIIKVQVTGEVARPDVYTMQPGDRVQDAINRAGGFTDQADQSRLDLAQRVKDEMRIDVPRLAVSPNAPGAATVSSAISPLAASSVTVSTVSSIVGGKINVNTATVAELDKFLPGVGPTLAQRIVDYRTKNGPFKSVDDLSKISGLTKSVLEKIKDLISF